MKLLYILFPIHMTIVNTQTLVDSIDGHKKVNKKQKYIIIYDQDISLIYRFIYNCHFVNEMNKLFL